NSLPVKRIVSEVQRCSSRSRRPIPTPLFYRRVVEIGTGKSTLASALNYSLWKERDFMNTDVQKGNWEEMKGKIKQKWSKFTDQDLKAVEGNFEELKGKLQRVYGYTKEKAQEEFKDVFQHFKDTKEKLKAEGTQKANEKIDIAKAKVDDVNRS